MKPPASKLQHAQTEETTETQHAAAQTHAHEFKSPEEMIRTDAAQTPVPESVRTRLASSVQQTPAAAKSRPWWKRFLA